MPQDEEESGPPLALGSPGEAVSPLPKAPLPPEQQQLSIAFALAGIVDQFSINPVLLLPSAIIMSGWIGFPMAVCMFALSIYTAMLLGRCWIIAESIEPKMATRTQHPYRALVTLAWGNTAGIVTNIFVNGAVFTSNIPCLVIASQNIQSMDAKLGGFFNNLPYCYWLIILGALSCPLTWMGSPKDLRWLSAVSSCAVVVSTVLMWLSMFWDENAASSFREVPPVSWQNLAVAYGILALQCACHPTILCIQADMKKKEDLSKSVVLSFFLTGGLFITTSVIAVNLYGSGVDNILTEGLPSSVILYINNGIITLQLFLCYVCGGYQNFHDIEEKLGIPDDLCWQRCVLRTFVVMVAVLLAEMLPRFDYVMGLFGGLFTGPVTFIFPPLLYAKLRSMLPKGNDKDESEEPRISKTTAVEKQKFKLLVKKFFQKYFLTLDVNLDEGSVNNLESIVLWIIVIVGITASVSAVYFSLRGIVWTATFVPPCLFDAKAAASVIY